MILIAKFAKFIENHYSIFIDFYWRKRIKRSLKVSYSPDLRENPFVPGFGTKDLERRRENG